MKAVVLIQKGSPEQAFAIREHPEPELRSGFVRIEAEAFGLNFADVMARQGLYREAPPMPCVIGYEVVGLVSEVGDGVDVDWLGKRVVGFTRFGGYAEQVVTDVRAIAEIGNMDAGCALALSVQYCTAWHCLQKANVFAGTHVLVHAAAGGVGVALTQLAKNQGCVVYGTVGSPAKAEFARSNGVDHAINYRETDYLEEVNKRLLEGERIYATFNAVGGKSFKKDLRLLGHGGTVVCFGAADRSGKSGGFFANLGLVFGMGFLHPLFLMMKSQTVAGVNMLKVADHYPEKLQEAMQSVVALTNAGKLNPHVGAEFPVADIAQAHELLGSRKSMGKVVVKW